MRESVIILGVVLTAVTVLTISSGAVAAAGTTDVRTAPGSVNIDAGETKQINVTATSVDDGVGSFNFILTTGGTGTISIIDAERYGTPSVGGSEISSDGSEVNITASYLSNTPPSGEVTLANVTIVGNAAGQTQLSIDGSEVGDEAGDAYTISNTAGSTISVRESTAIQNAELSPDTVEEEQTETTNINYDVVDVSNDGNADTFSITGSSDVSFEAPSVTVTTDSGTRVQLEDEPTIEDSSGTDDKVSFAISPDNSVDSSRLNVQVEMNTRYPAVTSNQSLDFSLDVSDSSGESATGQVSTTVVNVERSNDGGDATQSISLVPTEQNVTTGGEEIYNINVSNVNNGVGSLDVRVSVGDTSIAKITDATDEVGTTIGPGTQLESDGSSARIEGSAVGGGLSATGEVNIATVTISGAAPGETTLTINSGADVGDQGGNSYIISDTTDAIINVTDEPAGPEDVTGNGVAPTDPDGDGLYEDINGNGAVGFSDLTALFEAFNNNRINDTNQQFFNFNGQGGVGFADITSIYNNELQ